MEMPPPGHYNGRKMITIRLRVLAMPSWGDLLIHGGIFLAVVIVLAAAVIGLRRRHQRTVSEPLEAFCTRGFSIEELERLHGRGLISDEEFASLRRRALGVHAQAGKNPDHSIMPEQAETDENNT